MISLPIFPHLLLAGTCSCLCIQACPSLGFASLVSRERGSWRHYNRPWTREKCSKVGPWKVRMIKKARQPVRKGSNMRSKKVGEYFSKVKCIELRLKFSKIKALIKKFWKIKLKNLCSSLCFLEDFWGKGVPFSLWEWFNIEEFALIVPHTCTPERHVGNILT